LPAFGVLEIEDGLVAGSHGWILGRDRVPLPELSWHGGPTERIRPQNRFRRARRLRGACLSLASDWSFQNYAHFVLDSIGRLALFEAAGRSLELVDHVYCPPPPSTAAAGVFDRLGIEARKRIYATRDAFFRADVLIVPSFPGYGRTYQTWLPDFLQRRLLVRDEGATRLLYVSRADTTRRPLKEDELFELLRRRGFEFYKPSDHLDQPEDFRAAAVVVGAHGAGLANLAFCRRGTKVLELIPTDNAYPFYYSLAVSAELDYSYIAGHSTATRAPDAFGPSPYDFEINPDELEAAVDELVAA
jgi:capsular polysaccharide biosynthesis protein